MRMWMVPVQYMCRKHLLGEHVEHHMLVGSINKGLSMAGFVANNLLEPRSILTRHYELACEMERRGYKHKSPLMEVDLSGLPAEHALATVDVESSLLDLISRCPDCKARYYEQVEAGHGLAA